MKIAFVHPDLGIGGAERLVVDAALGLQNRGHQVLIYTSHHTPDHCFEETRNGTLKVLAYDPAPFLPRTLFNKFHILLAHLRQIHLTLWHILPSLSSESPDLFFVDQLSTCVPLIRILGRKRVVFYCHFPDFLLADGEFREGSDRPKAGLLKWLYRMPMDWWEEWSTGQADVILANSGFTSRVFTTYFKTLESKHPQVVWPGINVKIYEEDVDWEDHSLKSLYSDRPTLVSINRFEKKKNAQLAVSAFALVRRDYPTLRLVLAGGYDPRLEDNLLTLYGLNDLVKAENLTYNLVTSPSKTTKLPPLNVTAANPDVLFLLNFTTTQRNALLKSPTTKALLYTPTNEHFGIGPVEGMICSLPILACASGGPLESVIPSPSPDCTGWLCPPDPEAWATALSEILSLGAAEHALIGARGRKRAMEHFSMEGMTDGIERAAMDVSLRGDVHPNWRVRATVAILLLACLLATTIFTETRHLLTF